MDSSLGALLWKSFRSSFNIRRNPPHDGLVVLLSWTEDQRMPRVKWSDVDWINGKLTVERGMMPAS